MTALRAALGGVGGYYEGVSAEREAKRLEEQQRQALERQRELDRIGMLDKGYMTPEEAGAERQAGGAALSRALASASGMLAGRGAPAFGQGIGAGDGTAIVRGMGQVGPQQRATLGGQTFVRAEPESARMRAQELAAGRERMGEERKQAQARTEKQTAEDEQVKAFVAAGATEQQARAAVRGGAKYGDLFMSPAEKARQEAENRRIGLEAQRLELLKKQQPTPKTTPTAGQETVLPSVADAANYFQTIADKKNAGAAVKRFNPTAVALANQMQQQGGYGSILAGAAAGALGPFTPRGLRVTDDDLEYVERAGAVADAVARASEVGVLTNFDINRFRNQIIFTAMDTPAGMRRKMERAAQWASWLATNKGTLDSGTGTLTPPPMDMGLGIRPSNTEAMQYQQGQRPSGQSPQSRFDQRVQRGMDSLGAASLVNEETQAANIGRFPASRPPLSSFER
jgi:hypothetical protein